MLGIVALAVVAGVVIGGAIGVGYLIWSIASEVRARGKFESRHICRDCRQPMHPVGVRPTDEMYGDQAVTWSCPSGHTYRTGGRRFAEW